MVGLFHAAAHPAAAQPGAQHLFGPGIAAPTRHSSRLGMATRQAPPSSQGASKPPAGAGARTRQPGARQPQAAHRNGTGSTSTAAPAWPGHQLNTPAHGGKPGSNRTAAAQPTAAAWAPDRQRTARRGVGRQGEPPSRLFPAMCATLRHASAAATGPASPPSTGLGRHGQQHGTASPAAQHRTAQVARQPRVAHRSGQGWPPAHQARGAKAPAKQEEKKGGRFIRNE